MTLTDALDRTARQVRYDRGGLPAHQLYGEPYSTPLGRQYRTACGSTLNAADGAMLTTREVSCGLCAVLLAADPEGWT